jgi:hypothetical protein
LDRRYAIVKIGLVVVIVIGIATAVLVASSQSAGPAVAPEPAATESTEPVAGDSTAPVVVELFTSQGCSSCPPADKLLAEVSSDPKYAGRVIGLSFHVDYWNRIGWEDPFSSPAWTERQHAYARVLSLGNVYTPQAVVNGEHQFVGSDAGELKRAIASAAAPLAEVKLSAVRDGARVRVSVNAELVKAVDAAEYFVYVALAEREITTKVLRGENSGRTLVNDHVVRRLEKPIRMLGKRGSAAEGSVTFDLDPSWKSDKLEVVAFVQDQMSMKIVGAAVVKP